MVGGKGVVSSEILGFAWEGCLMNTDSVVGWGREREVIDRWVWHMVMRMMVDVWSAGGQTLVADIQITLGLPFSLHLANTKQYLSEEPCRKMTQSDPIHLGIRSPLMKICNVRLMITE